MTAHGFLAGCTVAIGLSMGLLGCGSSDRQNGSTETVSEEGGHAHGPDSHTHDAVAADTAGTYVDSTGAFFDDDEEAETSDHEHGDDTHVHD